MSIASVEMIYINCKKTNLINGLACFFDNFGKYTPCLYRTRVSFRNVMQAFDIA